jgi:hypothetical protein
VKNMLANYLSAIHNLSTACIFALARCLMTFFQSASPLATIQFVVNISCFFWSGQDLSLVQSYRPVPFEGIADGNPQCFFLGRNNNNITTFYLYCVEHNIIYRGQNMD